MLLQLSLSLFIYIYIYNHNNIELELLTRKKYYIQIGKEYHNKKIKINKIIRK